MLNYRQASLGLRDAWFKYKSTNQCNSLVDFAAGYNSCLANQPSDLIMFYYGEKVDKCNHRLGDILEFTQKQGEEHHDYIQWLFPNKEASGFNPNAPLLTDDDIAKFKDNAMLTMNVQDAVDYFMGHLGFVSNGSVGIYFEYVPSFYTKACVLGQFNHNHLRITRMIKFLRAIQHPVLNAVYHTVMDNCPIYESREYWSEAYNG